MATSITTLPLSNNSTSSALFPTTTSGSLSQALRNATDSLGTTSSTDTSGKSASEVAKENLGLGTIATEGSIPGGISKANREAQTKIAEDLTQTGSNKNIYTGGTYLTREGTAANNVIEQGQKQYEQNQPEKQDEIHSYTKQDNGTYIDDATGRVYDADGNYIGVISSYYGEDLRPANHWQQTLDDDIEDAENDIQRAWYGFLKGLGTDAAGIANAVTNETWYASHPGQTNAVFLQDDGTLTNAYNDVVYEPSDLVRELGNEASATDTSELVTELENGEEASVADVYNDMRNLSDVKTGLEDYTEEELADMSLSERSRLGDVVDADDCFAEYLADTGMNYANFMNFQLDGTYDEWKAYVQAYPSCYVPFYDEFDYNELVDGISDESFDAFWNHYKPMEIEQFLNSGEDYIALTGSSIANTYDWAQYLTDAGFEASGYLDEEGYLLPGAFLYDYEGDEDYADSGISNADEEAANEEYLFQELMMGTVLENEAKAQAAAEAGDQDLANLYLAAIPYGYNDFTQLNDIAPDLNSYVLFENSDELGNEISLPDYGVTTNWSDFADYLSEAYGDEVAREDIIKTLEDTANDMNRVYRDEYNVDQFGTLTNNDDALLATLYDIYQNNPDYFASPYDMYTYNTAGVPVPGSENQLYVTHPQLFYSMNRESDEDEEEQ